MNILNQLALILITIFLVSCGGSSGNDTSLKEIESLQGTWISSCGYLSSLNTHYATRYVFKGNEFTQHVDFHSYSDCSDAPGKLVLFPSYTRIFELGGTTTTASGLSANKLDITDTEEQRTTYTIIKIESVDSTKRISFGANSVGENDGTTPERRINSLVASTYYTYQ